MGQGLEDVTDAAVFKALLREALHRRVALVVDVFKDFDKGDGNIDKKGFKKALRRLGLSEATPRKLVNALWGSWDADCSGSLGIAELRKVLRSERKGGDGIMSDDAAALLESRAREAKRQALKDQAAARRAMIQAAERNAQANKQQMEALNKVESLYRDLGVHGKEALALFAQWDVDGDGLVSRLEFRRAMEVLGLGNEKSVIDALFDLMDYDDSGDITTAELGQALTPSLSLTLTIFLPLTLPNPNPNPNPKPLPTPLPTPTPTPTPSRRSRGRSPRAAPSASSRASPSSPSAPWARPSASRALHSTRP